MFLNRLYGLVGAGLLGALSLQAAPAIAAPASSGAGSIVLVASGGWATRAEGKQSTYDTPYDNGYGYGPYGSGAYGDEGPYGEPAYAYGPTPYGSGYGDAPGADYDED